MDFDVSSLGTILGIWAHPDDEIFCMGGLMAMAIRNGQQVACVTATRGEAGVQDELRWSGQNLGKIRTEELNKAYELLGGVDHFWLDYEDGCCRQASTDEACMKLSRIIAEVNPDTIFTFGSDGMTGHDDHKTVSMWCRESCKKLDLPIYHPIHTPEQLKAIEPLDKALNIFFNVDHPDSCRASDCDIYIELDDSSFNKKYESLRAMPSQTERLIKQFGSDLRLPLGVEAFLKF